MRLLVWRPLRPILLFSILILGTCAGLVAKEVPLQSPIFRTWRMDFSPQNPSAPPGANSNLPIGYAQIGKVDESGHPEILVFNDPCAVGSLPGIYHLHLTEGGALKSVTGAAARAACRSTYNSMNPERFAVGDFDRDGLIDFASWGSQTLFLQKADGGLLTLPIILPLDPTEGESDPPYLISGDLNRDGIPDVVVSQFFQVFSGTFPFYTYHSGTNLYVFLADGHGGFVRSQKITAPVASSQDLVLNPLALQDFTGDGIPDYLGYGSGPKGSWEILPGDGAGHLLPPEQGIGVPSLSPINPYGFGPLVAAAGDFNGDGLPDLAVNNGALSIVMSSAPGLFSPPRTLPVPPDFQGFYTVRIADVDGDGRPDLQLLGNGLAATYRGTADGVDPSPQLQRVPLSVSGSLTMRWDEDPYPDRVYYGSSDNFNYNGQFRSLSVFLSRHENDQVTISPPWVNGSPRAVGDFDGDGEQDLLFAGYNRIVVYRGNGRGGFRAIPDSAAPPGANFADTLVADFNGDGRDDIAFLMGPAAPGGSGNLAIYLGQPPGQPPVLLLTKPTGLHPISATAADFNGDGILDLAVADQGIQDNSCRCTHGGTISTYLGLGGGYLGEPTKVIDSDPPGYLPGITDIQAGRVNADDIPDLLILFSYFDYRVGSYGTWADGLGDGQFDGPYVFNQNSSVLGSFFSLPPPADVNGDGLPDIGMSPVTLYDYQHPQFGTFLGHAQEDFSQFGIASSCCFNPGRFIDLDGDGYLDLIGPDLGSDYLQFGAGTGAGDFVPRAPFYSPSGHTLNQAYPLLRGVTPAPLFADFNDDGREDMVVSDLDGTGVYLLLNRSGRIASDPAESLQDPVPGAPRVDPEIDLAEIQARVGSYDFSGVGIPQGALVFTLSLNDLPAPADSEGEVAGDRDSQRDGIAPAGGEGSSRGRPGPTSPDPGWRNGRPSMKSGRFQIFLNFGEPLRDSDGDGTLDLSIANAYGEPGLAGIPLADITLNLRLDGGGPPFTGLHNLGRFSTVDRERGIATFVVPYADLLAAMAPAERAAMDQGDGTGRLFLWAVSHLYGDQDRIPDTNDGADPTIRSEVREFRFPLKDLRVTSALTFGRVLLTSHLDGPVTLANHGVAPVTVEGVETPDTTLSLSASPPLQVPGGGRSQSTLRYAPTEHAYISGSVGFQSDDPGKPLIEMRPLGQGVAPVIRVSSDSLDFGSAPVGLAAPPGYGLALSISNDGDTTLEVDWEMFDPNAEFSFNNDYYYVPPPEFRHFSVNMGKTQTFYLRFFPNRLGLSQATFRMTSNDPFRPRVDVALSGTGTAPEPRISMEYTFQGYQSITDAPMGGEGSVTFRVSNVGSAPLHILSVTSDRPEFSGAVVPATIDAGSVGTLTVTYRPTTWGHFGAHISVGSDDPTNPTVTGFVGGSAFEPPPRLRLSRTALDFGEVDPGAPVTLSFVISNDGSSPTTGPLRLNSFSPPADYCMTQSDLTFPQLIEPGASTTVHVTLTPDINKTFCGTYTFNSNDPNFYTVTIAIQADILWPVVTYTPDWLSFPYTPVGSTSTLNVEIGNQGRSPLQITQVVFGRSGFRLDGSLPAPIPPGGAMNLPVVFAPGATEEFFSDMVLFTNDPSQKMVTIYLEGMGVPAGYPTTRINRSGD